MNPKISIITSMNNKERILFFINLLNEYALNQNKSVFLPIFYVPKNFYLSKLIALLSGESYKIIETYLDPTLGVSHTTKEKINPTKFVNAIEKIRSSDLIMSKNKFSDETYLEFIFEHNSKYDCILIDDFDDFISSTPEDIETIFNQIENYAKENQSEVILFMNEKDIENYQIPKNYQIGKIENEIKITYNKENFSIEEID
ncbi:MAG: hypothetical protein HFJ02_01055 [Bacilli bacterium]|nr:hypothetical protein [Bacilli bacterium]